MDELRRMQRAIEGWAHEYGLDFFDVIFEVIDYKRMSEVAAYGGFPVRYPHWRFGMEYEHLSKSRTYGLSTIYELVVNNDPAYAYLLAGNPFVVQKMVMAHVLAHVDFFKNNVFFEPTNRKMIDEMANHAVRIQRYMDQYGVEQVENFVDTCLSLENLIDVHKPYRNPPKSEDDDSARDKAPAQQETPPYLEKFVRSMRTEPVQEEQEQPRIAFPERPDRDVLSFLLEHAPLETWERNVLEIIRDEAYYFAPQAMTKIMNEGWASFWHSKIMVERALTDAEVIDFAEINAGVLARSPYRINPYAVGYALFEDIQERWDKGRFGPEWDECTDPTEKLHWDRKLGLGMEKLFEVRRFHNDVTFIEEFFTEDFCRRHKFFNYSYNSKRDQWEIESRKFPEIKNRLLMLLTNQGNPRIQVIDGNYRNRGELLLEHLYDGVELKLDEARATLENLYRIWSRPVHIQTVLQDTPTLLSFDGSTHSERAKP